MNSEIKKLTNEIAALCTRAGATAENPITLMEVCGTHTMSIARFGLRQLLPEGVRLLSGPGCPVCVTPNSAIDAMIEIARQPGVIVCTFGDMMRVPGSRSSLLAAKAEGADVRVVYSPLDALAIAEEETDKTIVFLGVGFETTAPVSAAVIKRAAGAGMLHADSAGTTAGAVTEAATAAGLNLQNFCIYSAHKNMPGALELIAGDPALCVDGFILPGHVSTITGLQQFEFLARDYNVPGVVSGFEAEEILLCAKMLCEQVVNIRGAAGDTSREMSGESCEESGQSREKSGSVQASAVDSHAKIENAYTRGVRDEGNTQAQALIAEVFETCDAEWRGLGVIKNSGYSIRPEFAKFDASLRFAEVIEKMALAAEHKGCRCGDILKGTITPNQCPLFGVACTPENPIGPCMVSNEGTCAAYFRYHL